MKLLASVSLETIVQSFCARFPNLQTRSGSYNRCKFISYELALHLRRRGIKAKALHVQGLQPECPWMQTAHQTWVDKPRKQWSHYVVAVGSTIIDCTVKQFDPSMTSPWITTRAELKTHWVTVETDTFVNNMITEVLRAQTDANRVLRGAPVKKIRMDPVGSIGSPTQQVQSPT